MFILTFILLIAAPAGIPLTGMVDTPALYGPVGNEPSGIGTLMVPAVKVAVLVDEDALVNLTAGSPRHMVTDDGVTVGAGGV